MNTMDPIGIYKCKGISTMNRDELLDFARWAGKHIPYLQRIADKHHEFDIKQEVFMPLVSRQNRVGGWVPAIPEPYPMFPSGNRCDCGKKFFTREGYDAHYALKHILFV